MFLKNIVIVASGSTVARLIVVLTSPIVTRLYSPQDFGIFAAFSSITSVLAVLATLRYAIAIPVERDEKLADNLLQLCLFITFSLSFLCLLGLFFFGDYITEKYLTKELRIFIWIIPIVFFGQGFYETLNNWAIRGKKFNLITRTKISQGISSSLIKVGFGYLALIPLGLFIGKIVETFSGIGSLLLSFLKEKPRFYKNYSWQKLKFVAVKYKKFPLIQTWSNLLMTLSSQLPILFIGAFYGSNVLGLFALAIAMISLPTTLIGQSIAQVYYSEITSYGTNNPQKIYDLTLSIMKNMLKISLFPVITLIIFGPWMFSLFFGFEWYDSGIYARYYSINIIFSLILTPITNIFNLYQKQEVQLKLNIIRLTFVVMVFYICHYLDFSAKSAIIFYSLFIAIFSVYTMFTILKIVKKLKLNNV
jgi:O-antigen/teichoic acid export membrane protein